jgi:hypothetical protein
MASVPTPTTKKTKTTLEAELIAERAKVKLLENQLKALEVNEGHKQLARELLSIMGAFTEAGFTRDEAFQLLCKLFPTLNQTS